MPIKLSVRVASLQKAFKAASTKATTPKSVPNTPAAPERGKPSDGKTRDAGGHEIDAGGHRVYPDAGVKGGTLYRDKRGYVQYGVRAPPKGSRFDTPVPDRMTDEEKVQAAKTGAPAVDAATVHTNMQNLLAFAEIHRFGQGMERKFDKKITNEDKGTLWAGAVAPAGPLVGRQLLTALIAKQMGRTVKDLGDLNYIGTTAYRLGTPLEDVWNAAFEETVRDPETGVLPDDFEAQAAQAWEEFTGAYNEVMKDPVVQSAAKALLRKKKTADMAMASRIEELRPHLDKFAENILNSESDKDTLALQISMLADHMGMVYTPFALDDIQPMTDPITGDLISAKKQRQHVGKLNVDPGELAAVVTRLDAVAGTPQGSLGLSLVLPILQRYKDHFDNERLATEDAPNHYEKQISSYLKPDGTPKDDFVSLPSLSATPSGRTQLELLQEDGSAFWKDARKHWFNDPKSGAIVQDNGLEDLITNYLQKRNPEHFSDPDALLHMVRHVNEIGAHWRDRVEAYNDGKAGDPGWAITSAALTGRASFDKVFNDPAAAEGIIADAHEHAERVSRALAAQESDPKDLKLPDWLEEHLAKTIDERTGKPLTIPPYQRQAIKWMMEAQGGILAYDAGLGKTIIATIASAMLKHNDPTNCPRTILFLPKVILNQFPTEIRKWLGPKARIKVIGSDEDGPLAMTQNERLAVLRDIQSGHLDADFVVCSASTLRLTDESRKRLIDDGVMIERPGKKPIKNPEISSQEYRNRLRAAISDDPIVSTLRSIKGMMVCDESHHATLGLKDPLNHGHLIAKELVKDRKYKFGMTATPAPNKVDDLFHQAQIFCPGAVNPDLKVFREANSMLEDRPVFDEDGNPVIGENGEQEIEQVPVYHEHFIQHNDQLKHAVFVKSKEDPVVQEQLRAAGLGLTGLTIKRHVLPVSTEEAALHSRIEQGMDHPRRLRDAEAKNAQRIARFRDQLADLVNPEYANYDDKKLLGLLDEGASIVDPEGNVVELANYGINQPRLDRPRTYADVKDSDNVHLYVNSMAQEAALVPHLVDPEYNGPATKIDYCVDQVLQHFSTPSNARKPLVIAAEHVSAFPFLIEKLVKAGVNRSLIAEIKGGGDSGMGDPRAAQDRDAIAQAVNQGKIKVLLLGSKAGGAGLNLNGSRDGSGPSKMLTLQEPYTPTDLTQLMARIWRAGQMSDVEVHHINLNIEQDFSRMKKIYEKTSRLYLLLEKQSERVGMAARAGYMAELLLHELKKMGSIKPDVTIGQLKAAQEGSIDPSEVMYGPISKEEALANIERLGFTDDMTREAALKHLQDNYYHKPFQRFVSYERFVKNGFDRIMNKRQAAESMFRNGLDGMTKERLAAEKEKLAKQLDHWYAAAAAYSKVPLLIAKDQKPKTAHSAGGIKFLAAKNPFKRHVVEDENRKLQYADKDEHPEAVTAHNDRPGKGGKYTDFYLWEAARKNNITSVEDMIERVIKPLAQQVGHWSPEVKKDLEQRIGQRFEQWEADGHIAPIGSTAKAAPARMPVGEGHSVEEDDEDDLSDKPPMVSGDSEADAEEAPEEGAEEAPVAEAAPEPTPAPQNAPTATAEPSMGAPAEVPNEPAPEEERTSHFPLKMTTGGATGTPKFKDVKFQHGGKAKVIPSALLGGHWGKIKEKLSGPDGVADPDALLHAISGGKLKGEEYHEAAHALAKEFRRAGLIDGPKKGTASMRPRKPRAEKQFSAKVTTKGFSVGTLPGIKINTEKEQGTIPPKAATALWKRIVQHTSSGGAISSHKELIEIFKKAGMNVGPHHLPTVEALVAEFKKLGLLEA